MRLITVHSLRGGAGRTTLALRKARESGPGTVLIETDLTGTSLCDVLPLRAPDLGSLPDEALKLTSKPRSWYSTAESRARMELRHRSAPWGLPFLNDWLLFTPEQDARAGDARAEALLWMEDPDQGLRIIPASPLPQDQLATQVFNDEPHTGFVESRLEFLVAALLGTGVSTLVFDTGRGLRGVPGAVLSLALRLASKQPLSEGGILPKVLERTPMDVEVLLLCADDRPAIDRWLAYCTEAERPRVTVVARTP